MTMTDQGKKTMSTQELDVLIENALKKVKGSNENDLCKYLPGPKGGYMHHFTLRKLKHSNPTELFSMLQEFIMRSERPLVIDPKPRAPRGSRKKKEFPSFTRVDIERIADLARRVGDKDLLARVSPKRPLNALKRGLIRSIKENRIDKESWDTFVEAISSAEYTSV